MFRCVPYELQNEALMISTIRQAKKDYYEASDSFLQIGHLLGSSGVQREFLTKSSKMSASQ